MKRRYKIILNVDIGGPDRPFPAGGDFMHLNRIQGVVHLLLGACWLDKSSIAITLDKVIDKGVVTGVKAVSNRWDESTTLQVSSHITLTLHQSEMFGARYQLNLLLDKRHNFALTVEQARQLHRAFGQLLAKVEEE